ncbi:MAG: chemotaxis protein CheD [Leptospiraceae bacterium]|nr:chemotaxis protein CheD [Leptospiraceae bacterium]
MSLPEHILEIFLMPGDFYWGDSSTRIRTVLGSCISICIWHPVKKQGGMCHYMLPTRNSNLTADNVKLNGKYGDEAWEIFLREMNKAKTRPSEYLVKLFGGSNMFTPTEKNFPDMGVGNKNIELARRIISEYKLNLVSENLGGNKPRRIHFDIWSGNVWLRRQENE